jgi:hypothetical protein
VSGDSAISICLIDDDYKFHHLSRALSQTGAFDLYTSLKALACLWIILWVPETKQYSLKY